MAGADIITAGQNPAPAPQMPGQVTITSPTYQPGNNSSSAPVIRTGSAPNVTGGNASFSPLTQSISDLIDSKKAELSAGMDALSANQKVDASAAAANEGYNAATITALTNMKKAQGLPGNIAKWIGFVDSDYNVDKQKTDIAINTQRADQTAATAKALKEQNNTLPLVLGKVSEAQKIVFDAQKDANDLAIKQNTLNNEIMRTRLQAGELRIHQSAEQRNATEFAVRGMTTAQLQTQLPIAEAGKGKFAGLGGILEERLVHEQQAKVSLDQSQNALKQGNRDEYNNSSIDLFSHIPADVTGGLIHQAQTNGTGIVNMPTGEKGPDGKPVMVQFPVDLAQQGLVKNLAIQKQVDTQLAADYTQKTNLIPNATNLMNTGNMFASVDQRATQLVVNLGAAMQGLNAHDPNSVRQVGFAVQNYKDQMDEVIKDNAAKYSTPEARNAIISAGKAGGKFDTVGGTAVTADSIGIPSLVLNSKYKTAFGLITNGVAQDLRRQKASEMGGIKPVNTGNSSADAMTMMAQMMARPDGRESINKTTQEWLLNPNNSKVVSAAIQDNIKTAAVNNTFVGLAHQPNANPIWNDIVQHPEQFEKNGKIDTNLIFNKLETATVLSGGKLNYTAQFMSALSNYGMNANNASASDPSYGISDHALEAAVFGGAPHQQIVGDLHYQFRQIGTRAHQEMQQRIQQDLTGKTVYDAVLRADPLYQDQPGMVISDPSTWAKIKQHTGVDPMTVPSATGTGMNVTQIKQMYGGQ